MTRISLLRATPPVIVGGDEVTPLHAGYDSPAGGSAAFSVTGAIAVHSTTDDHRIWKNSQSNVLSICNEHATGDSAIKFLANAAEGHREQAAIGYTTTHQSGAFAFTGAAFWESSNFVNGDGTTDYTRGFTKMHIVQTGTVSTTTAAGTAITGGFSAYVRIACDENGAINMYGIAPNVVRWTLDGNGVVYMRSVPTNPSANPSNGGFLYVDTAGVLKYRGLSGTVTTLANA